MSDGKDLLVVSAATKEQGMLQSYRQQLKAADIEFVFEHLLAMPNNVGNLAFKLDALERFVDRFGDRKYVFSDAWDVRFYGTKEEVLSKIPNEGVLLAAERNCWPDAYLQDVFPQTGTPWRYVNGGLLCGTAESFVKWIQGIRKDKAYFPEMIDQQWFNFQRIRQSEHTYLDSRANLFYCLVLEAGELEFRNGRPHNTLCNTWPNFLHFNGKYPTAPIAMMEEASLMYGRVVNAIGETHAE